MTARRLTACGLALLAAGRASAAPPVAPPGLVLTSAFGDPFADRPTELPPLLTPPPDAPTPCPVCPPPDRPRTDYDPGYLYLPDANPAPAAAAPCPCQKSGRWWLAPTLELGGTKSAFVPALLRYGVADGSGVAAGRAVYGGNRVSLPFRAGVGLSAGAWFDRCQTRGVDASFYHLQEGSAETSALSDGSPLLVPTTTAGRPTFFPLAFPGVGGRFRAEYETRYTAADVNYRRTLLCDGAVRLDALAGYRYAHVGEDLDLSLTQMRALGTAAATDHVHAGNDFHGGQVGLAGAYRAGRWSADLTGKVAFGTTFTTTESRGAAAANGTALPIGFFSASNAGTRDGTHYAVLPSVNVALGRQVGEHARLFVGYSFQYLSTVTRAADVFDPRPDPSGTGPRREEGTSDFWAQSFNLGMDWRY